ncbi:hypothetical protein KPATCC21470_8437 [Kitasatospora purpeofusca]
MFNGRRLTTTLALLGAMATGGAVAAAPAGAAPRAAGSQTTLASVGILGEPLRPTVRGSRPTRPVCRPRTATAETPTPGPGPSASGGPGLVEGRNPAWKNIDEGRQARSTAVPVRWQKDPRPSFPRILKM